MSLGAERRTESRLRKLEDMIRDPRSAINLESLLVSRVGYRSSIIDHVRRVARQPARLALVLEQTDFFISFLFSAHVVFEQSIL